MLDDLPHTNTDPDTIHDSPLYLPSLLSPDTRKSCSGRLVSMEKELRIGQCRDSLIQLRTKLNARARLTNHKYVNVRHQLPNTRSRDLLNRTNARINAFVAKYRNSLARLEALEESTEPEWRSEFLDLGVNDIRALDESELPKAPTEERARKLQERALLNGGALPEGSRTVSWIWRGSLRDPGTKDVHSEYGEGRCFRLMA